MEQAGGDLPHATSFSSSRAKRLLRVVAQPGVHRRRLDHRARRRHQPVEALGLLEPRDRPGVLVARGDPRHRVEVRAHLRHVELRRERREPRLVERDPRRQVAPRAAEEHHADVHALAALDAGHDAHDRVLERAHGSHPRGRAEPARQVRRSTRSASIQSARHRVDRRADAASVGHVRDALGSGSARDRQQHVIRDDRERLHRIHRRIPVAMVEEQRRAVVDQPQPLVPDEQVRVARRAVDVRDQRVEPHDRRRLLGTRLEAGRRRVRQRAGQEVEPDVDAGRPRDQVLDLRIRLRRAQRRVDLHEHDLRHRQPEPPRQLPAHDLRHQRLDAPARRRGTSGRTARRRPPPRARAASRPPAGGSHNASRSRIAGPARPRSLSPPTAWRIPPLPGGCECANAGRRVKHRSGWGSMTTRTDIALLFPGQGSQTPDMRDDVARELPDLLDRCIELVGEDPFAARRRVHALRPARDLLRLDRRLGRAPTPQPTPAAGHSLGELGALAAAGVLERERRARARRAARPPDGRGRRRRLDARAARRRARGRARRSPQAAGVTVANDNAPGQVVLSGERERARRGRGGRRASTTAARDPLDVAGAFHSPAMEPAVAPFRAALDEVEISATPASPSSRGATAAPFADVRARARRGARSARSAGARRSSRCTRRAPSDFVETGPGNVLAGLAKRTRRRTHRRTRHAAQCRSAPVAARRPAATRATPPRTAAIARPRPPPARAGRQQRADRRAPRHRRRLDRQAHRHPRAPPRDAARAARATSPPRAGTAARSRTPGIDAGRARPRARRDHHAPTRSRPNAAPLVATALGAGKRRRDRHRRRLHRRS